MNKLKKPLWICIIFCLLTVFSLEIVVINKSDAYTPIPSQAAVILGHSLMEDGITPNTFMVDRLEKGLALYQDGYCNLLVVTGGKGPQDNIPVAQAMKTWLVDHGIPAEAILEENRASTTYENMKFSKELLDVYSIDSVIIVTSDFHILRAMWIGEQFFSSISGAAAPSAFSFQTVIWFAREPFSIIKNFFVGNLA